MIKSPVKIDEYLKNEYSCIFAESERIKSKFLFEICEQMTDGIEKIKHDIFEKFVQCVKLDDRLPGFDEKIYDYYYELIMHYKNAVKIYDEGKDNLVSENIKRLLDGLNSVLKSRISQFEEINSIAEMRYGKKGFFNPVYLEKQSIVEKFVSYINKDFDSFDFNDFFNVCLSCKDINKEFNDRFYDMISQCFNNHLKNCIIFLNDIEKRDVTAFYFEMIKEEKELLSSVIRVQADVLEKEIQTAQEEEFIQSILFQLRDAYQHINKHVDIVVDKFSSVDKKPVFLEVKLDNFELIKENDSFKKEYIKSFIPLKQKFADVISVILENINSDKNDVFEKIRKSFSNSFKLCESIRNIFFGINAFYDDVRFELEKSAEKNILDGIYDTIKIKVESLNESLIFLKNEGVEILNKKNIQPFKLNDKEKEIISGELFDYFIMESNVKEIDDNAADKIKDTFAYKLGRDNKNIADKADKKLLQFKKEQLLFEITTFEEIMNYSISRLRKSENRSVREYVNAVDFAVESIDRCLEEFGITIIRPLSHQMFNGKEHEVLMAEKSKEFNKGEIIKVMNSGFKENDLVIIRANVIAAR